MSDTVKLIIEIPKELHEALLNGYEEPYSRMFSDVVKNGIPLDDVKAEIAKEIIPRNSDDYDHDTMYQNCGLRMALKILDNIGKAESEDISHIFDNVSQEQFEKIAKEITKWDSKKLIGGEE